LFHSQDNSQVNFSPRRSRTSSHFDVDCQIILWARATNQ
jgi:hypothetical protein